MADGLYEADILEWSTQQAELLRRAAAGERVNGLDWPNLVEEIESVGRSELRSCESFLFQALRHLLKCAAEPGSASVGHWRGEIAAFLFEAQNAYTPSMAQRIDLGGSMKRLGRRCVEDPDTHSATDLLDECPFSLVELLAENPAIEAWVARLQSAGHARDA